MKVLITGAQGMLGRDLTPTLAREHEVIGTDIQEMDITNYELVSNVVTANHPDLVVHCAAFTDVDGSERQNEQAFLINASGTGNIALACRRLGVKLLYVSTDFVFDGTLRRPYREEDAVNPLNRYGASKLAGELAVRILLDKYLIIRTSWLFGRHGKNFVASILHQARTKTELSVVNDQHGCPTSTIDLSEAIAALIQADAGGVVHVCCPPETTWFDFARAIIRSAEIETVQIHPITSEVLNRPARRPSYSALDIGRYQKLTGCAPRSWLEALQEYIQATEPGRS